MRQLLLGLCIFTAACSELGGPLSPTAPSVANEVTGAQLQATGDPTIEVKFAKWVDPVLGFPKFTGTASGDVTGAFAATVLDIKPFANDNIIDLRAQYEVIADDPTRSFTVEIEGKQNNQTNRAVLNGTVVDGWLSGARVHVTFDVIQPCPKYGQTRCFEGILRVLAGSAH